MISTGTKCYGDNYGNGIIISYNVNFLKEYIAVGTAVNGGGNGSRAAGGQIDGTAGVQGKKIYY